MSSDLMHHPKFDFSSYQPGDVIAIPMAEIINRGQAEALLIIAAIANAATRAGLNWRTERSVHDNCMRVFFSEEGDTLGGALPEHVEEYEEARK